MLPHSVKQTNSLLTSKCTSFSTIILQFNSTAPVNLSCSYDWGQDEGHMIIFMLSLKNPLMQRTGLVIE